MAKSDDEINRIFEKTKSQRLCDNWFSERRKRLTASNFGKIVKLRASTDKNKVAQSLISSTFMGNVSTRYGVEHETLAIKDLAQVLEVDIKDSGLIIHKENPFLAASPDGLIGNNIIVK